ncbi:MULTISPECIES: MarR family winged helix-turn-helix transcriptional regulator [Tenacibaculum]|uniref:MarR family transcriptional regulator n=1 Tax=Tenacibaculum discolor TaxID=361581 RepID=A0A2G1BVA6_9FLAO|nr:MULTISPECIES: MarR family transcriptional regulator [Tenacibaculum]PHO01945.1 MarR family transcriptional regulator [Rhodobacteraceae bacterium 4F10]MDP2540032.1 MarR family transcriptional regulator [Tenacibaculum discolor]NVK09584.1 MarR family transcriptional regulator [Tenacibaculum sp.]PHN97991.1 MarR family transcriptional regulator [Tenacibaculum discolor]RLK03070.1 MarR family transcriptional regulator [Tenacibaculum discolor]
MKNTINFNFENPNENLGYLLWQTTMLWQRQMNRALDEIGLTHTQFVILMALAWLLKTSEEVTQKEIADHSNTDRMMVSKILRTLQKNKLIERKEHKTDTRAKCVFLTQTGIEVLQKAIDIKTAANNLFFSKLTDKKQFAQQLKLIIE